MRHRVAGRKFSRHTQHRELMFRNMLVSLIAHERIKTTLPKAKEFRSWADKMITLGKKGDVTSRRRAFDLLRDREAVKKLFDVIAPSFKDRQGGYTRVYKMGYRLGDAAPMGLIELTSYVSPEKGKKSVVKKAKQALKKVSPKKKEKGGEKEVKKEAKKEVKKEAKKETKKEDKKETPKGRAKKKPTEEKSE